MWRALGFMAIAAVMAGTAGAGGDAPSTALAERPAAWAQPIAMDGAPNLHQVSDTLYRSAQPTAAGMRNLENLGIRTVLNLRSFHSDRDEIKATKLRYEHLFMKAWHPEEKEAVAFLKLMAAPDRLPLLVHCQHGADRTGALCAVYRIVVQGWTREQALREMTEGGFGFHEIWANMAPWLMQLDVETIRREAGIPPPAGDRASPPIIPPAPQLQ